VTAKPRQELDAGALRGWVRYDGPRRVLLLHGGPGISHEYLDDLVEELDGWSVASYQQRGLRPSTPEGPFDIATAVSDMATVLDALGWDRAHLLGHSWGGHLAMHSAWQLPDRVKAVLAVDPIGAVGDGGGAEFEANLIARIPHEARERVEEIGDTDDEAEADESLRLVWPGYFANPAAAPPYRSLPLSQAAFLGLMADLEVQLPHLEEALPSVSPPLGVVVGADSPMPVSAASDVVDRVPGAWLEVVDGAGHFVWLEAPGAVRAALDRLTGC
jgi:pimeloyl-ACP methyl ester carboxylesterase